MSRARDIANLIGGATPDIILKTADGAILNLQTSDTTVTDGSVLGKINFQAPNEGSGTDSILIAASIQAEAEGTFSASNNATSVIIYTGESEAAETDGGGKFTFDSFGQLFLKNTSNADNSVPALRLETGDTDIAADDMLGRIMFSAPDEGAGTDAILVGAEIRAVSEGNFSSSNNATKLVFMTGASESATEKMSLSSAGVLTADGGIDVDNFHIDGTTIALSGTNADMTLDTVRNIHLDAGGGNIIFYDDGSQIGAVTISTTDVVLQATVEDRDIIFKGNDGNATTTLLTLDVSAAGAAIFNNNVTAFSDRRLKSDIQTVENALEKVEQLRGVTYIRDDNVDGGQQLGVIAQEVEEVFPQVVLTSDDERGTKSVDYGRLTGALIEAVKELSAKVKELEGKLN